MNDEDALHRAVAQYLTASIAPPGQSRDGAMWFSIEHRNAQSAVEGRKRKDRGVVAGVPDILIVSHGRLTPIELKAPKGRLSGAQDAFHGSLLFSGVMPSVCRSVDDVAGVLHARQIPHRAAVQ